MLVNKKVDFISKILKNKMLQKNLYLIELSKPEDIHFKSGQFVNLRIDNNTHDPLLRRPFSIFDVQKKSFQILYQVKGKGTSILSIQDVGDELAVLGPLGNGFDMEKGSKINFFIAGGIGLASLIYTAKELKTNNEGQNILLYGARDINYLLKEKFYKNIFDKTYYALDVINDKKLTKQYHNGSVISLLNNLYNNEYSNYKKEDFSCFICGPDPMMKAFIVWNNNNELNSQLSLESFMGCGFKACLGCAVKVKSGGYKYVCHDGPVFNWNELEL